MSTYQGVMIVTSLVALAGGLYGFYRMYKENYATLLELLLCGVLVAGGSFLFFYAIGTPGSTYKSPPNNPPVDSINAKTQDQVFASLLPQVKECEDNSVDHQDDECDKSIFAYPLVQALLILILVILITELSGNPFEFLLPKEGSQEK